MICDCTKMAGSVKGLIMKELMTKQLIGVNNAKQRKNHPLIKVNIEEIKDKSKRKHPNPRLTITTKT